jgi:glutamate-1-semialdehyde 2,1-aminomutase
MFTLFFGVGEVHSKEMAKRADLVKFQEFFRHILMRGVLIPPSQYEVLFISAAHTEDELKIAQDGILEFIEKL